MEPEEQKPKEPSGYGSRWKRYLLIYAAAGLVIYLLVYLIFFRGGGGY